MSINLLREKKTESFTVRLYPSQHETLKALYEKYKARLNAENFTDFVLAMIVQADNFLKGEEAS